MTSVRVTFESGGTERATAEAAELAFKAVAQQLFGRMQDSFGEVVWTWPRRTLRQNEQEVFSPRNIIDISNLRQTGYWKLEGPFSAAFMWSADYAVWVHEGARLRSGQIMPARPWTKAVTGEEPVQGISVYPTPERMNAFLSAYMRQRLRGR